MIARLTRARVHGTRARVATLSDEHQRQVVNRKLAAVRLVGANSTTADRIETAPAGYLLAHHSSDIVRHCGLLSPLPAPNQVRAVVTPGRTRGEWHLDVVSRDRPGLLAAFTGVLAGSGIEVVQAVLATWDDDGALEAFVVRASGPPDPDVLQDAFEASLEELLCSPAVADATITFGGGASGMYTRCDVHAVDRPGLLHAVAVAIATAGADVHAARVTTIGGVAHDRFDLSDQGGRRLDATLEEAIRSGVVGGVRPGRREWSPSSVRA